MKKQCITLGIAEYHILFRKALLQLFTTFEHTRVIFDVSNGEDVRERLQKGRYRKSSCLICKCR